MYEFLSFLLSRMLDLISTEILLLSTIYAICFLPSTVYSSIIYHLLQDADAEINAQTDSEVDLSLGLMPFLISEKLKTTSRVPWAP